MKKRIQNVHEIIEMAWCDKTSFEDIKIHTGLSEIDTIKLMRQNLKPSSFRLWRKRVSGRIAKHKKKQYHLKRVSPKDLEKNGCSNFGWPGTLDKKKTKNHVQGELPL
jgi:uncharacterized protein (TIGR03643 family)